MKTIEEGAKEFVDAPCDWLCANCTTDKMSCRFYNDKESFKAGAEWREKELTRWHDPKDIMPEPGKKVLVKCISGEIQTDFYEPELDGFFIEHATYAKVIGWREMHD